jgi:hypothetical protein
MPTQPNTPIRSDCAQAFVALDARQGRDEQRIQHEVGQRKAHRGQHQHAGIDGHRARQQPCQQRAHGEHGQAGHRGLAMRLLQREVVRKAPTPASPAAASAAASGPCISSSRNMKISPAANEILVRGMRTGKKPASMASTVTRGHLAPDLQRLGRQQHQRPTRVADPASTTAHQYRRADRL